MERKTSETIESFVKHNDVMAKLRAALETIEQGQSYKVFEGLQRDGACCVFIIYEGENVTFRASTPTIDCRDYILQPKFTFEASDNNPERTAKPETTRKAKTK